VLCPLALSLAVTVSACRRPEQPVTPSRPTDPTNARAGDPILDSSIVSDAGLFFDVGAFDVGASPVRQVAR
jgi:hypothetical protein